MSERVQRDSAYLNGISTTGTLTRVRDVSPTSGMCPICIRECPFLCEISLSAFRGREALYPVSKQYGKSTAASLKGYHLDWSDFNILPSVLGVEGIKADSDLALFPNVDVSTTIMGIPHKIPVVNGAFGSTEIGRVHWDGLAVGSAISGTSVVIGENVCGMDPNAQFVGGKVTHSEEMARRVRKFREFWDGKNGDVIVQTNVEDQRMGVDVYALSKLEVNVIERKWGQGAKAIGGEVRINDIDRAVMLKKRGYLVIPDPEDQVVREAFKQNSKSVFDSFERHSRVGIPEHKGFLEDVDSLRKQGAKKVTIKTGAYRPLAVAFTLKVASEAKVNAVVFDGAGGGTGMSPVPMMNEMGIPTVYLEALVLRCCGILKKKGKYVPDVVMAGGFINETQIFKSIAMSNFGDEPVVKAIVMARAPLTAVMKASYFTELAKAGRLPKAFSEEYSDSPEKFFIATPKLKQDYGEDFKKIPWEAVGLYTFLNERVKVGLQQLMAGARKWRLNLLDRDDLASLSTRAEKVTRIPLMEDVESEQIEQLLG